MPSTDHPLAVSDDQSRAHLLGLVGAIEPWDDLERTHLGTATQWIAGGAPLHRVREPDVPAMHLLNPPPAKAGGGFKSASRSRRTWRRPGRDCWSWARASRITSLMRPRLGFSPIPPGTPSASSEADRGSQGFDLLGRDGEAEPCAPGARTGACIRGRRPHRHGAGRHHPRRGAGNAAVVVTTPAGSATVAGGFTSARPHAASVRGSPGTRTPSTPGRPSGEGNVPQAALSPRHSTGHLHRPSGSARHRRGPHAATASTETAGCRPWPKHAR